MIYVSSTQGLEVSGTTEQDPLFMVNYRNMLTF